MCFRSRNTDPTCRLVPSPPPQVVGDAHPEVAQGADDAAADGGGGEYEFVGERDGEDGGTGSGEGGKGGMQTLAAATEEQAAASRPDGAPDGGDEGAPALEDPAAQPAGEDAEMAEAAAAEEVEPGKPGADATANAAPEQARDQSKRRAAKSREKGAAKAGDDEQDAEAAAAAEAEERERQRQAALGGSGAGPQPDALTPPEAAGDASLISVQLERTSLDASPPLSEEEQALLRERTEECLEAMRARSAAGGGATSAEASALWAQFETLTSSLSAELCEQLRLILEPTLAARLQGDYKTGRRLNMRKIIPYIASDFRRDKIWLRRSKPSVRRYQARRSADPGLHTVCARGRPPRPRAGRDGSRGLALEHQDGSCDEQNYPIAYRTKAEDCNN